MFDIQLNLSKSKEIVKFFKKFTGNYNSYLSEMTL